LSATFVKILERPVTDVYASRKVKDVDVVAHSRQVLNTQISQTEAPSNVQVSQHPAAKGQVLMAESVRAMQCDTSRPSSSFTC